MAKQNVSLHQFNRGIISPLALARVDVERVALSAETMTNFMPRVLGSMMLRPGLEYIKSLNASGFIDVKLIPFVYSVSDTALIELYLQTTMYTCRILTDGDTDIPAPTVSSSIVNSDFLTDLTSWTDDDEAGATSEWDTYGGAGACKLTGTSTAEAIRYQLVIVDVDDQNIEHFIEVRNDGDVRLRIGTTSTTDDYISETLLETGMHIFSFTPTGNFYIQLVNRNQYPSYVYDCRTRSGEDSLILELAGAPSDLGSVRYTQSGNIIFLAATATTPFQIKRYGTNSWGITEYYSNNGPFLNDNVTTTTMTASALSGTATITSSDNYFNSNHVGALLRHVSDGQTVTADLTAEDTYTNTIKVEGVGTDRVFTITREGTWVATVTLQRSLTSDTGPWESLTPTWTANEVGSYDDSLDNQIAWYRIGIESGDYTSGTVELTLDYPIGTITGIGRITDYTDVNTVTVNILEDFGGTTATDEWAEGAWSDNRGWPSSVTLTEGRLWWAGKDKVWGSVSDDYYNFDDRTVGDSGPISRSIGAGPVDTINWLLPLQRLIAGAQGAEFVCRSNSFDEPLTPTNFNIKPSSDQGSSAVDAIRVDRTGIFAQRGGTRVMQLVHSGDDYEYSANDLTVLAPEVCQPQIVRMAVQRQPDTRIHCVLSDGTVAVLVYDRAEEVKCWSKVTTDGTILDVGVLPGAVGDSEDKVFYVVSRVIDGSTVYYLEKWAKESECEGATLNKQADAFTSVSQVSSTTISGLTYLEGESVVVWANGKDLGSYTVSSGSITVSEAVTTAIVGLTYTAQWKSSKLAYAARGGSALTQKKAIDHLGVILINTHYQGLEYGPDFTTMDNLPKTKNGAILADDTIHATYDQETFSFQGRWNTDSRLCLQATAPKPCNILASVIGLDTNEKH